MDEEILMKKTITNLFNDLLDNRKKYLEFLFNQDHNQEREEILTQIEEIIFSISLYFMNLKKVFTYPISEDFEYEDFEYSEGIKKFIADRVLFVTKLEPPLFNLTELYKSHADLDMGISYTDEAEVVIMENGMQEYYKLEKKINTLISSQTNLNPYFFKIDNEFVIIEPQKEISLEENPIKSYLDQRILLLKYLESANLLSLKKINQDDSSQAIILGFLMGNSINTTRAKLGQSIIQLKTKKNLKVLLAIENFEKFFPEVYKKIKEDHDNLSY